MNIAISHTRLARVLLCLCPLWLARADAADPAVSSLTLAEAVALATQRSAAVAAFAAETQAASARVGMDALRPADVIEGEFENFAGSGNLSGVGALESTVRFTRILELGDKRNLRRQMGDAELHRLATEQGIRQADIAAEVARRFVHVISDQEQLAATRRASELARTARDVARERVEAGATSPAASSRAEIALERAHIEEEHAEHELSSSRVRLAVLWGDRRAQFGMAAGNLLELPASETLEAYEAKLSASPELSRYAAHTQLQQARLRLAQANKSPDIALSAGVRRLEVFDDAALVAAFSIPLGNKRRAELQRREVQADLQRISLEQQTSELDLHARLYELYQELQHARTEAEALSQRIRPQAMSLLKITSEGYRAGRYSLLELADAQTQLLEVERDAIRAAEEFHTWLIDIRRLIGEPLNAFDQEPAP